jgi:hypothetical protein
MFPWISTVRQFIERSDAISPPVIEVFVVMFGYLHYLVLLVGALCNNGGISGGVTLTRGVG